MTGLNRKAKHVPERTCIACRQKRAKWELVRIVRNPQGELEIDLRGKKAGRGAYVCKSKDCWNTALAKKKLDSALKYQVTVEERNSLKEYSERLFSTVEEQGMSV